MLPKCTCRQKQKLMNKAQFATCSQSLTHPNVCDRACPPRREKGGHAKNIALNAISGIESCEVPGLRRQGPKYGNLPASGCSDTAHCLRSGNCQGTLCKHEPRKLLCPTPGATLPTGRSIKFASGETLSGATSSACTFTQTPKCFNFSVSSLGGPRLMFEGL